MKFKKQNNKNMLIALLTVLLLAVGVGYAIFSDLLMISGTANAKGTFNLEFQNAEIVTLVGVNDEETKVEISEDKNTLNVNVVDLAYPGAGAEFSVDIVNVGTIQARINAVTPTNITGSEHIKIEGLDVITTDHPIIEAGGKCNIHFTVEWPATSTNPLVENEESTSFGLEIEYTQGTGKEFEGNAKHEDEVIGSTPPIVPEIPKDALVKTIQPSDYGKAINYSTTVEGEVVDNWKVFYNDGTNVYIILDNYLPNKLVPKEAGLKNTYTYNVYSDVDRDTLLTGLTTEGYWSQFANGVEDATAVGGPTNAQFVASWNENPIVNSIKLTEETNTRGLTDKSKLYITSGLSNCYGYWLLSSYINDDKSIWYADYKGQVLANYYNTYEYYGVRPLVKLPTNVTGTVGETIEIEKI